MNILVIDGMGGGVGRAVIERIRAASAEHVITAIGTNAIATASMHKAGANMAATGENAIIHNCNSGGADCIIGTIGIIFANAMLGEISPRIAEAVSSSKAVKILIPTAKCNVMLVGLADRPLAQYIDEIPSMLERVNV